MQSHTTSHLETENKRSFQWVLGGWDARHQEFRYFWGLGKVRLGNIAIYASGGHLSGSLEKKPETKPKKR